MLLLPIHKPAPRTAPSMRATLNYHKNAIWMHKKLRKTNLFRCIEFIANTTPINYHELWKNGKIHGTEETNRN